MPEQITASSRMAGNGESDHPDTDASKDPLVAEPSADGALITVIGFDYGARRIGVAVGNRISSSARALDVVGNGANGPDWLRIAALLRDWHPDALLVGLPLMLDSSEQANSIAARAFGAALAERHKLPVILVDERLSSREASHRFAKRRADGTARRKHAAALDAVAAEVIVERWLRDAAAIPSTQA
jgi:putative holliday junction resolvase